MPRPDYTVRVLDKETDARGEIGVAWNNDDGAIGIKFNPFIENIPHGDRYAISLFPVDRERREDDGRRSRRDEPRSDHRRAGRRRS